MTSRDVHPDEMPDDRLDAFFDELRTAAAGAPMPVVGDALATLFRDGRAPVAAPAPGVRRRRRWSARAAVAGAVAGVTFGGLGIAGALPAPVQRGVADVVRHVGVKIPDPTPATTTTTSTTVAPTTTTDAPKRIEAPTPPSTVPERGNSEEHRQDDRDDTSDRGRGNNDSSNDDDDARRRNPASRDDVHPTDGPQAADRHDNRGGSSE